MRAISEAETNLCRSDIKLNLSEQVRKDEQNLSGEETNENEHRVVMYLSGKQQVHHFANKDLYSQSYDFSSSHIRM